MNMTHRQGSFEWDTVKDAKNVAKHGISFSAASKIFDAWTYDLPANVVDGEVRTISFGELDGVVIVVWTYCHPRRRLISARPASLKERNLYHAAKKLRS